MSIAERTPTGMAPGRRGLRAPRPDTRVPPRGRARRPHGPALALALVSVLLGGCSFFDAPVVQRGNRVTADQLREITPGVQTKADVRAALGSPTQTGMFGDDEWYYISAATRQRPGRQFVVNDRQTVVVEFDRAGVVRQVRTLGEDDTRAVEMVSRETPVPGNERTFLQALFGNIGRFGPGAATQGPQQVTPGAGAIGQSASGLTPTR